MKKILLIISICLGMVVIGLVIHTNQDIPKASELVLQNNEALAKSEDIDLGYYCARKPGGVRCPKNHANRKWVHHIVLAWEIFIYEDGDEGECELD